MGHRVSKKPWKRLARNVGKMGSERLVQMDISTIEKIKMRLVDEDESMEEMDGGQKKIKTVLSQCSPAERSQLLGMELLGAWDPSKSFGIDEDFFKMSRHFVFV